MVNLFNGGYPMPDDRHDPAEDIDEPHTCKDCPFAVFYASFGGRGNRRYGWYCKIAQGIATRTTEKIIFEINSDEARTLDVELLLAEHGFMHDHYLVRYRDMSLYTHLPSPFSSDHGEDWMPSWHLSRWILNWQECFITPEQVADFVDLYREYKDDARKKVHNASNELTEMNRWVMLAERRLNEERNE